jgi:carboxymethylenebutenolidase
MHSTRSKIPLLWFVLVTPFVASLAPAQDWAKARLENSPRHGEWVKVPSGDGEIDCFVVYPEVSEKATSVLVIHEIFGLTDWARGVCDQLAEAGYVAVAPDMLSGQSFTGVDAARKAISKLTPEQIATALKSTANYAKALPASNGNLAVIGFCWGGTQAFRFAGDGPRLDVALPFYGNPPQTESEAAAISCPLYGFFGGNDARINAMLPKGEELLTAAGKTYNFKTYPGAGHGYMRAGEAPDASPENKKAWEASWERLKKILAGI